jgi:hypothetical protein
MFFLLFGNAGGFTCPQVYPDISRNSVKTIYPCNRPWRPIGLWDVETPTFSLDNRLTDGGEIVSLTSRPSFTPQEDSWHPFILEAESTHGHSAAGRIRLIEKSNDLIGIRTRNLPAGSIVSQPTTLPRASSPLLFVYHSYDKQILVLILGRQNQAGCEKQGI